jgi:hypothetical protein
MYKFLQDYSGLPLQKNQNYKLSYYLNYAEEADAHDYGQRVHQLLDHCPILQALSAPPNCKPNAQVAEKVGTVECQLFLVDEGAKVAGGHVGRCANDHPLILK